MSMFRLAVSFFLAVPLLYSQAQSSSADLRGSVLDPSGASLADAKLTITDPQTGLTRTTTTGKDGEFLFSLVPPSKYNLHVEASGFTPKNVQEIELHVGDTVKVSVSLSLAQVGAEVD